MVANAGVFPEILETVQTAKVTFSVNQRHCCWYYIRYDTCYFLVVFQLPLFGSNPIRTSIAEIQKFFFWAGMGKPHLHFDTGVNITVTSARFAPDMRVRFQTAKNIFKVIIIQGHSGRIGAIG